MTKNQIYDSVMRALKSGCWMLRGVRRLHRDFSIGHKLIPGGSLVSAWDNKTTWKIGEWTEEGDWLPDHGCGNGLHGVDQWASGFTTCGNELLFCRTSREKVEIPSFNLHADPDKIKVPKAMPLLVNNLSMIPCLKFKGDLNLSRTNITHLPQRLFVGGKLDLENCFHIRSWPKVLRARYVDLDVFPGRIFAKAPPKRILKLSR